MYIVTLLINLYAEYMQNAGLDEAQAGIRIARRNINNLRYADDTTLMTLLMKVKEESEKAGLKISIPKTKIMASGPITSWQNRWGDNENSDSLYFLSSKITVDSDCSHTPWKQSQDKPRQRIKRST